MPYVPGVKHRFLEIKGTTFHVAEAGDGPPLVLLHGWPQHWWSWREVISPLAETYRVICPDIRGLGWSGGWDGRYGHDDLAQDLIDVLDALGLERVRLVGHDWGLLAGYRACIMWPERFERYVALAGIHLWQGAQVRLIAIRRPWHVWAMAFIGGPALTRLNLADRVLRTWRHNGEFTEDECAIYLSAIRRPSSVRASIRFNRTFTFRDMARGMRKYKGWRMRVPTLHLLGANDPITPFVPDSYLEYADDMRLETIPECGHYIPEEAPDELLARLGPFL